MHKLSTAAEATDLVASDFPISDPDFDEDPEDPVEDAPAPFEGVPAVLRKALEGRGFTELSAVQKAVLDPAAEGRDLQISSQTGSGKTVALGLVLAPRLLEAANAGRASAELRSLRGLVIVPTRELAVQVSSELQWLFAGVPGLTVECMTGGSSVGQERRRLSMKPTVVVGTPGRLLDHIRTGALNCSSLVELVLDEADRMLDMGFREELEAILDATPAERSTHLVSATFPAEIRKLTLKYQTNPLTVQGTRLGAANEDIEHVGHLVRMHDRYDAIVNLLLLSEGERTLIFVNTRAQASELADQLSNDGFPAAPISGDLEQNQRTRTLEAFRNGNIGVLVATDVAARGLDIPEVALVIHTDAPFDSESYTHRAGRTGRAGRKGRSVLLSSPMRQKKVEFLMSRAKVKMQWREVPTASTVEKALAKRERRRLREALTTATEPTSSQLVSAAEMLEDMEAADVVVLIARLVELCRSPRRAMPRDIEGFTPHKAAARVRDERAPWKDRPTPANAPRFAAREDRGPAERHARPAADRFPREDRAHAARGHVEGGFRDDRAWSEPAYAERGSRDERGSADDRGGSRDSSSRFEINWGHRGGANPQRLLAVLCRRGDVSSRMIGAIDIDTHTTTFEVAGHASHEFEANVTRPDARDPHLRIRRARAAAGYYDAAPRRHARPNASRH